MTPSAEYYFQIPVVKLLNRLLKLFLELRAFMTYRPGLGVGHMRGPGLVQQFSQRSASRLSVGRSHR
jgi:hypothetical protein